jgi:hypothetical protein
MENYDNRSRGLLEGETDAEVRSAQLLFIQVSHVDYGSEGDAPGIAI